jgi:TRAP-type C4-dicarboxylate transport system permease large subunit
VQGARKSGSMTDVMVGTIPYVLTMLAMVAALIALPDIALFLPEAMGSR